MDRQDYTAAVLSALRRVTSRERAAIRAELDGHIEDHMEGLLELGYDPALAEERALAAMGDPKEVGRELNKQYTGWGWVLLSRAAMALAAALFVIVLVTISDVELIWRNIAARTDPEQAVYRYVLASNDGEHVYTKDLDIRAEVGSDVLYIYRVGVMAFEEDGTAWASVWACNYDRRWLGVPSESLLWDLAFTTETKEQTEGLTGYQRYCDWVNIQVTRDDAYIVACYQKNGYDVRVEIPLCWEEWEADAAS